MRFDIRLFDTIAALGFLVLAASLGWWWLVFEEVVANDYLSYSQAAVCIGGASDLCALAQALCTSNHRLGITTYSSTVFWIGLATLSAGLLLRSTRRAI